MGIRESLREQPEADNLKDFVIEEESEKEFVPKFDAREAWGDKGGDEIFDDIDDFKREDKYVNFISDLGVLKMVWPKKFDLVKITEHDKEKISKSLKDLLVKINAYHSDDPKNVGVDFARSALGRMLEGLYIVFPDDFDKYLQAIRFKWENIRRALSSSLQTFRERINREQINRNFFDFLRGVKLFLPEKFSELNFELDHDDVCRQIETALQYSRRTGRRWRELISILASIRLIFPDDFKKIEICERDWQVLNRMVKKNHPDIIFPDQALDLNIIAAEEVRFENGKLKIIMKDEEGFKTVNRKRPERREF